MKQGRGNSLHFVLNVKKALFITFDNVRDDEGFASIYTRVCFSRTLMLDSLAASGGLRTVGLCSV